jgi:hypothetical protein
MSSRFASTEVGIEGERLIGISCTVHISGRAGFWWQRIRKNTSG